MDFEPTYRVFPGREINDSGMISIYLENLKTNTTSEIKRISFVQILMLSFKSGKRTPPSSVSEGGSSFILNICIAFFPCSLCHFQHSSCLLDFRYFEETFGTQGHFHVASACHSLVVD